MHKLMYANPGRTADAYRSLELETSLAQADPHALITMLFDAVLGAIARARTALQAGEIPARGEATGRALRLLDEGLKASLDPRGGELSSNLKALYEYMSHRLLSGNANADDAPYVEVAGMLEQLRDAWRTIAPQVRRTGRAA